VIAGNDLLTPGGSSETLTPGKRNQEEMILEAVKAGKLPESTLDRNVTRYLKAVLKSPTMRGYQRSGKPDLQRDAQVARAAATDGIILLKNEGGTLPLHKEIDRIALFGNASYRLITGGTGSGFVWVANQNPIAEALASTGYRIDERLKATYHGYLTDYDRDYPRKDHVSELFNPTPPAPEMAVDPELIKDHAEKFDIAIVTLGRVSGENLDRERDDFSLTRQERTLIEAVSDAFHANGKKVIVVLNIGGMINIASWRDKADAIVLPWLPGQEGGNAVVDILTGRVTPSGKLATTYPLSLEQVPADDNFPGTLYPELAEPGFMTYKYIPGEVTYEEGIFSGYRYHDTFNKVPAYPFGYGLSYTRFALSDLQVSAPEFAGVMDVSVTVTNTGERHGKEVVQLYLGAPANKLEKPRKELKAFSKTRQLAPGDSQRVTLTLQGMDLASFDPGQSAWVAEAGRYLVQLGTDVSNIVLTGSFTLDRDRIIETTNPVLVPVRQINEIGSRQAH